MKRFEINYLKEVIKVFVKGLKKLPRKTKNDMLTVNSFNVILANLKQLPLYYKKYNSLASAKRQVR